MSQSHRVRFVARDGTEATVVVKLASEDPRSRATGVGMGAYEREISFYRHLAGRIGGPLAACYLAEFDPAEGWFTPRARGRCGGQAGGSDRGLLGRRGPARAARARTRSRPRLGDLALGAADWLNKPNPLNQALLTGLLPSFLERYGERVTPEHAEVCERFVASIDGWARDRRPPLGLVHGDYRLDNLLFDRGYLHGGGLADGRLGSGDARRVLLHRRRADGRRSACA